MKPKAALEPSSPRAHARALATGPALAFAMAAAIVVVAAIAYWDERRESAAALQDFAEEQATLASALTVGLATAEDSERVATLLASMKSVERPGSVHIYARSPSVAGLVATNARTVRSKPIEDAIARSKSSVRLSRDEAAELGLPARMAIAGIGSVDAASTSAARGWSVAVVATAQRERDRETRAQGRLVLGVLLAAGLVLVFGGLAMRKQKKELDLARELAIAEVRRDRDERLVRADKLATMGALATGIAHEVSTPLGVIVGRVEQLAPKLAGDEKTKRALDAISEQAERIDRIIRGFLGLVRGDAPAMEIALPQTLARAAVGLVEHRFVQANVSLALVFDESSELPAIACEPRLFEQVLVNLLLNACDACDGGGTVTLTLKRVARTNDAGERVVFEVDDDGSGISPEAAARATEPFFTTKPAGKGTGLGLAIASEIVKHHRGTLVLHARERARGTRAIVEVPASKESDGNEG